MVTQEETDLLDYKGIQVNEVMTAHQAEMEREGRTAGLELMADLVIVVHQVHQALMVSLGNQAHKDNQV